MNYWPLLAVVVVVVGFMRRWNPVLVVMAAALTAGLTAGMSPQRLLTEIGEGFAKNRYLLIIILTLPVLGALERAGLREHARQWIARRHGLTPGRLMTLYLAVRQSAAAMGLTSLGGHPQTVRPLLAPMAEGAARAVHGPIGPKLRERLRAMAAATDNVGLFFGEDIFIAFGAVLLMQGLYAENGIVMEPLHIALWGIPTAILAFAIHAWRLHRFDKRMAKAVNDEKSAGGPADD
ncbi:MAG: DUF969 domain-containing protein [Gammaproteobacteria bacterium]